MIAFGSSISGGEAYRRYAQPGIRLASEPDSVNFAYAAVEPIGRTYNLILDAAARRDDLEALVLVHPHTEIIDPGVLRQGEDGARARRRGHGGLGRCHRCALSIAWWEGEVTAAPAIHRYEEHGGGDAPVAVVDAASPRRPRRWSAWTGSCWSSRRGRCARCASTRGCCSATALTWTSACRCAPPDAG